MEIGKIGNTYAPQYNATSKNISTSNTINFKGSNAIPNDEFNSSKKDNKKKVGKIIAIGAGIAAVGVAAYVLIKKGNLKKAQGAFDDLVKNAKKGNNNILSDALKKESDEVQKFIEKNPDDWQKIKDKLAGMVDIRNADDVLKDTKLYHGTSVDSAKNILKNGATPFSAKRSGSGSGMGHGIYTTPNLEAAKYYSNGGVVLPYKLKGKVAVLKEGVQSDKIKLQVMNGAGEALSPKPKTQSALQGIFGTRISGDAQKFAQEHQSTLATRALQEIGADAIYTKGATTRGGVLGFLNQSPQFLDDAGQIAVFNGSALDLDTKLLKELNPITKENYYKFL